MTRTARLPRSLTIAALVPAAVLLPASAGLADQAPTKAQAEYAERMQGGAGTAGAPVAPDGRTKAAIEHEELLRLRDSSPSPTTLSMPSEFPWVAVVTGTAAAGAVVAGGIVLVRRSHHAPASA